jgi:hypothetical protein
MKEHAFSISTEAIAKQVKAKAYYTGRSRGEASSTEAIITDILDKENEGFIRASVDSATASAQSIMGVFGPCSREVQTDGKVQFEATVPDHFDETAFLNLQTNITQYCEAKVLYDWFAVTSPADKETYAALMTQAASEIQSNMRRRMHPSRMDSSSGTPTNQASES